MWPGPLRRDHDHVVARRRRDAPVVDVEAVREEQRGAVGSRFGATSVS